jgi:hypothetical protein
MFPTFCIEKAKATQLEKEFLRMQGLFAKTKVFIADCMYCTYDRQKIKAIVRARCTRAGFRKFP